MAFLQEAVQSKLGTAPTPAAPAPTPTTAFEGMELSPSVFGGAGLTKVQKRPNPSAVASSYTETAPAAPTTAMATLAAANPAMRTTAGGYRAPPPMSERPMVGGGSSQSRGWGLQQPMQGMVQAGMPASEQGKGSFRQSPVFQFLQKFLGRLQ